MPRLSAYYREVLERFRATSPAHILGILTSAHAHALEVEERLAWEEELGILASATSGLSGTVYLEFEIPRRARRIDAVIVAGSAVFPIEFKCGADSFTTLAYNQVWDYALDLKNFHTTSHEVPILPILVATKAERTDPLWESPHTDGVRPPRRCGAGELSRLLHEGLDLVSGDRIDGVAWGDGAYQPTPTIVEAAQVLYARHSVDAISRNDAGAKNLHQTSGRVEEIIERTRTNNEKAIVFVTGVPGAGKTLVGLNIATKRQRSHDVRSVYLSGNGPLVAVLQEALTLDEYERVRKAERKGDIRRKVELFIQNVHTFRDEGVRDEERLPYDHVVIFDEAQRAWNQTKTADFMRRRKEIPGFLHSEPEFLVSYLDRHQTWAVVVCLVGGGQEIYTGEAGISEWLTAIRTRFPKWRSYISENLADSEYSASEALRALEAECSVEWDDRLHLNTSMRSFRSEKVSAFVSAALACDISSARELLLEVTRRYPIVVSRDLDKAKHWVRSQARGTERYGLVASSEAQRLKPHAIDIRVKVDPIQWFLKDRTDTRSSFYLEDAATEFQVQGLELDWACVTWDADLRLKNGAWNFHSFRGDKWQNINQPERRRYLTNAYRVLLTRARQGMVVFVPTGDSADPTRPPAFYDETYEYLRSLGLPPI